MFNKTNLKCKELKMKLYEYVVACVHLYGMIHEDRIVKIYNKHHPNKTISVLPDFDKEGLEKDFVHYAHGFYIHQAIYYNNDMAQHLDETNGKPYYIPKEEELTRYLDDNYFERNRSVETLEAYIKEHLVKDNEELADDLLYDTVLAANGKNNIKFVLERFTRLGIRFNENEINDFINMVNDVYNNSKIWLNNGFSPKELFTYQDRYVNARRNDLCPCQSGKKFKHCCMNLGYINDDLGKLVYDNIFLVKDKEKESFKKALLFHMEKLDDAFLDLENPSYKDFTNDFIYSIYEEYNHCDLKIISGAIIRSLLVFHKLDDLETRFENILRQLKVWTKKAEILRIYNEIDDVFFVNDKLNHISGLYLNIMHVFNDLSYKSKEIYVHEDSYTKLLDTFKEKSYCEEITSTLTDLSFDVFDSDLDDKEALFHHFLQITPYLPQTIQMLLNTQLNDQSKINLIKAYTKAYETVNEKDLIEPVHEFTRYKDHKQYILALADLAYSYKIKGDYKQAIEIYKKMSFYDDEDRFCAKESSLLCYLKLNQMDKFDQVLEDLEDDSLYKILLHMLFKLVRDEDYKELYLKAYNKSSHVLDVLCGFKDSFDDELTPIEKEFIEDFNKLFIEKAHILNNLKQTHKGHKLTIS
jgi:hypothetical protein